MRNSASLSLHLKTSAMKTSFFFRRALVAVLLISASALPANAQLQSYEFGAGFRSKKAISEDTDWQMHQKIFGLMMRGHGSVVDLIINRDHDRRFRFGDYLGTAFCTGFTKEEIISSGNSRKLNTMWITIDLQAGLQAAYNVNDQLTVGINAFKEFQFGFVVMTDYN